MLPRLYQIDSGKIEIDGVDIHKVKLEELRSQVSLAFEESFLFSNSAKENISLGSDKASQEQVQNAALIARAHEFIAQLPESYETKVGERGFGLSGGQRQRFMIAMSIIRKPRVIIADEPTTALDVTLQKQILDMLVTLKSNLDMSMILISHDINLIKKYCNRIIVMKEG